MNIDQLGVQLYTVRDSLTTPEGVRESFAKISGIGYRVVEMASIDCIPDEEIRAALDDAGLACCGLHESAELLVKNPEKAVARAEALGCEFVVFPYPVPYPIGTMEEVLSLAGHLRASEQVMLKGGKKLCYHHHNLEFFRIGGRTVLEIFLEQLPGFSWELDSYWVQAGGGEWSDWCGRLKGKLPLVHLKDYGISADYQPVFREVGEGNLDFHRIVNAAEEAGTQWFIVEQDECEGDPFECLEKSFRYISEHLLASQA